MGYFVVFSGPRTSPKFRALLIVVTLLRSRSRGIWQLSLVVVSLAFRGLIRLMQYLETRRNQQGGWSIAMLGE